MCNWYKTKYFSGSVSFRQFQDSKERFLKPNPVDLVWYFWSLGLSLVLKAEIDGFWGFRGF